MLIWIVVVIILLLIVLLLGSQRLSPPHYTSAVGIENPEAAQAYDRISQWPQFKFLRWMIVRELKRYHPKGMLVDAGCGPGYLVSVIARTFPDLRIIGVDISGEMVKLAKRNSAGFGERTGFRQGDIQKLPFEDNTVDFVISTLSMHHWQDPPQALKEFHRVLKPGGQFLLFDLRRDSRRWFYWLVWFAQTFVVPTPMRRENEPKVSLLSSYTPAEVTHFMSTVPLEKWGIKSVVAFMFVWGRKA